MLILKGFIIGLAKIIPGVSGSLVALNLGLYEKGIKAISNYFENIKENTFFIFKIGIGIISAIILGSKIIYFFLNNWPFLTMIMFIGLLLGSTHSIKKINTKREYFYIISSFLLMLFLFTIKTNVKYIYKDTFIDNLYVMLLGFIDASTMIIPAISGTVIFILLGCYDFILIMYSNCFNNIKVFSLFSIGLLIGIFIVSKAINYLLEKKKTFIYSIINGFFLSSMLYLVIETIKLNYTFIDILFSIPLIFLSYKIGSLSKK